MKQTNFSITLVVVLSCWMHTAQAQWQRVTAFPAVPVFALYSTDSALYAATANHIYHTIDGGATWQVSAPIQAAEDDEVTDLLVTSEVWYAATLLNGCHISIDRGASWQADNTGLSGLGSKNLSALAQRGDSLYVGTFGAGVFVKSLEPVGSAWTPFNLNIPWGNVQSLTVDGPRLLAGAGGNATLAHNTSPSTIWSEQAFDVFKGEISLFLGAWRDSQVLLGAGTQGLYRSTDAGLTWMHFNPGIGLIERAKFTAWEGKTVAMLSKPNGSFLRATTDHGLSWGAFQPNLPSGGLALDLLEHRGKLYCARTDGLWVLAPLVSTVDAREADFSTGAIYPNPANAGSVILPLTLRRKANVFMAMYDLQGKLLQILDTGSFNPGEHMLKFDYPELPNGTYVCALHVNGQVKSQLFQIQQ